MKEYFGFIGCGNMGGALAIAASKTLLGARVYLCDEIKEKTETLAACCGAHVTDLETLVNECRFLFLGVKPQSFSALFEELRPLLQKKSQPFVLVSMAAGITVAEIERLADCDCAVIRIMPNTPVAVGEGMILYTANTRVCEEDLDAFRFALSEAGVLDRIPEEKMDAASALSGCGPAYVYMFAEALADGGVECGLPRDKAMIYAAQTLLGAAKLLQESGKHPGELKDAVCSPGGTTIAGVHALEEGAFRAATINAVTKAYDRTLALKK